MVTKRMGLRYLWIDSLWSVIASSFSLHQVWRPAKLFPSTIQDSKEDWMHEAALMQKVYANCICSIALAHSSSPTEGLFWSCTPELQVHPFWAQFQPSDSTLYPIFDIRPCLNSIICWEPALYKRGWVVQELQLSPRTIHLSKLPAFECRRRRVYVSGTCDCVSTWSTWKTAPCNSIGDYSTWYDILIYYSKCGLTKHSDKLIAISGLAKMLSTSMHSLYSAGIWNKWWLEGLLWWRKLIIPKGSLWKPVDTAIEYVGMLLNCAVPAFASDFKLEQRLRGPGPLLGTLSTPGWKLL